LTVSIELDHDPLDRLDEVILIALSKYLFNKWGPTGVADPLKAGS